VIYDNIEFFNVEQLYENKNIPGKILGRYDLKTINVLDNGGDKLGAYAASYSNECEMRFVTKKKSIKIFLSTLEAEGRINVYNGDYYNSTYILEQGKINCINLNVNDRLYNSKEEKKDRRFDKNVWRIVFIKRFTAIYHGINVGNCKIRPPFKKELPKKTFLVYGSSVTFGAISGRESDLSHMQILARKLKYQVINKGMPGSCFGEKAITDLIKNINDVDFYIYELGGNMRVRYTVDEFKERFNYLLDETIKHHPNRLIFIIDVYWQLRHIPSENHEIVNKVIDGYNKVMYDYVNKSNNKNLILIDNKKILPDYSLMCADMIHPSPYGSIIMGENLNQIISKYVL